MIRRIGLLALSATLFACSSGGGGAISAPDADAGADASGITAELACAESANVYCDVLNRCAPFYVLTTFGSVDTCKMRQALGCTSYFGLVGTSETPERTFACWKAFVDFSCEDFLFTQKVPDECIYPPGALADGAPCAASLQCQSLYCRQDVGSGCGVCARQVPRGTPCTWNSDCENGLVCRGAGCVDQVEPGMPCDALHICNGVCNRGIDGTDPMGTCVAWVESAGADCDPIVNNCDVSFKGLICDAPTKTCQATAKLGNPGEPCVVSNVLCAANGYCAATLPGIDDTCRAGPVDGAPCQLDGPPCLDPALCIDGRCTVPDPTMCNASNDR